MEQDSRIRVIFRQDNVGWRKGISYCLQKAHGIYMMFLGADDYLATVHTLQEVCVEICQHKPDIVWTSCGFAVWENGNYKLVAQTKPEYRVYENENKVFQFAELMRTVYYNSVMHYVRIDFLKEHGIDFYQPFYGDCEGMTEAIAHAKKMVVMDKVSYILTTNTSQTAARVFFDYNTQRQWMSIRRVVQNGHEYPLETLSYIARRILANIVEVYQRIVLGEGITDSLMNPIERSFLERFARAEEMIDNNAMAEMMYYGGREEHAECLIGAAGIAYWMCKKNDDLLQQIHENSLWLADLAENIMDMDETGQVIWKTYISKEAGEKLIQIFQSDINKHYIGLELILKETVRFEDVQVKEKLAEILEQYLQKVHNRNA